MGERWGTCRRCKGQGTLLTEEGCRVLDESNWLPGRPLPEELKDRSNEQYWMECGSCLGEGFDGSAENCPF